MRLVLLQDNKGLRAGFSQGRLPRACKDLPGIHTYVNASILVHYGFGILR